LDEKVSQEIEILKKEILEMKSSNQIKTSVKSIANRLDSTKERISRIEVNAEELLHEKISNHDLNF
jgi:hypothetical protein